MHEESAPKTAQAARTVELFAETVRLLRTIQPLHVTPDTYVFINTIGTPIEGIGHPRPRHLRDEGHVHLDGVDGRREHRLARSTDRGPV